MHPLFLCKETLKNSKETAIKERNGTSPKKRQLRKETVKDQRNGKMQPPPPPFLCTFILFLCSLIFLQRNDSGKFSLCQIGQKQRRYGVFGIKKNATILYQSLRLDVSKNGDFDTIATIQSTVFYWWSAYSVGGAFGGGFGGTLENLIGPISFPPT